MAKLTLTFKDFIDDPDGELDQAGLMELAAEGFTEPPPGVDPIEARIIWASAQGEADLATCVELDPRDYIRQQVQYGSDLYEVLAELQPQLPAAEIAQLVEWLKVEPLTVAIISASPHGLDSWQAPARGL